MPAWHQICLFFTLKEWWKHWWVLIRVCVIILHMSHGIISAFFSSVWKLFALWTNVTDVTIQFNACSTAYLLTFSKLWLFYVAALFCFIILPEESSLWSAKRCFYLNHCSHISNIHILSLPGIPFTVSWYWQKAMK